MQKNRLHISITLQGPLLTQSSEPGQLGLDAVVARNHNQQAYIPGTLVSGKIRQALEELLNAVGSQNNIEWFAPDLDKWLGTASQYDFPKTKRLFFSDFTFDGTEPDTAVRHRIKIDPEREAVDPHQLAMQESPFVSGESYIFTGEIHFFSSAKAADTIIRHLQVALSWLSQLGANRTIGFGSVLEAKVENTDTLTIFPKRSIEQGDGADVGESIGFCIQPEYPFCLAGKPNSDNNLFESEVIIPGGAIKGCIATTWNHLLDRQSGSIDETGSDFTELRKNFSNLRIRHAFPGSEANKRPLVAPLSLVKTAKEPTLYDVALLSSPSLIDGKAPDFAVDWKDSADTLSMYPWPYIRRVDWGWDRLQTELRVRTAIDRAALRSAKNELFAYEQIIPEDKNWYGNLDLSKIDASDRDKVIEQLQAICSQGLIGLGKTKTPIRIEFNKTIQFTLPNDLNPVDDDLWLITLQTDALLGSPETLNEASGVLELRAMYQAAWNELSDGKLTLVRYFARQRLSGGRHRQRTRQNNLNSYRPWLLTEAGSIFVLKAQKDVDSEHIKQMLKGWLSSGIGLTKRVSAWYGLGDDSAQYWKFTPFVPENGYGEIAVNLRHPAVINLTDADKRISIKPIDSNKGGEEL